MPKSTRRSPRATFGLVGMAISVIAVLIGGWSGVARRSHYVTQNVAIAQGEQLGEISPSIDAELTTAETPTIPSNPKAARGFLLVVFGIVGRSSGLWLTGCCGESAGRVGVVTFIRYTPLRLPAAKP